MSPPLNCLQLPIAPLTKSFDLVGLISYEKPCGTMLLLVIVSVFLSLAVSDAIAEPEHFSIQHTTDPAYLPYRMENIPAGILENYRHEPPSLVRVREAKRGNLGQALFTAGFVAEPKYDIPSTIVFFDAIAGTVSDEFPLFGSYENHTTFFDPVANDEVLVRMSRWQDSMFLIRQFLSDNQRDTLFLVSGIDQTGDGVWNGTGAFADIIDVNLDGSPELYVFVAPGRDLEPRAVMSIDLGNFSVLWQMPLASLLTGFLPLPDSAEPSLCVVTYGPFNGTKDQRFSDEFGYVTRVGYDGNVLWNSIATAEFTKPLIVRLPGNSSLAVLFHTVPLGLSEERVRSLKRLQPTLSLLRLSDGTLVKSVPVEREVATFGFVCFDENRPPSLLTVSYDGVVSVFDQDLSLVRVSEPTDLYQFIDTIRVVDEALPAMLFARSEGVSLFSADFRQLATIESASFTTITPLVFDANGNVTEFISESGLLASIVKRPLLDFITVWFWRVRLYVLSLLSATIVGLVVMNFYRRRARSNMIVIADQKAQLERAHEQLKDAQATIVEQEKFQQAQDIAGGFAHEIRNALLPAVLGVYRLQEETNGFKTIASESAIVSRIDSSITNALRLIEMILNYTRLESVGECACLKVLDRARAVAGRFSDICANNETKIIVSGDGESVVSATPEQLDSMLQNLVLNSLQATEKSQEREIEVHVANNGPNVKIEIRDTGCGIEPSGLERAFDVFYSTRPNGGVGLGLGIVKKLTSVLGGQITLESEVGVGTLATLSLPSAGKKNHRLEGGRSGF